LTVVPRDLSTLAQVREALSGQALSLLALRGLLEADEGFAERFFPRILSSLFHHARALVDRDDPTLPIHRQGVTASTVIARATVSGWLSHLLLGTLSAPTRDHPDLDCSRLLDGTEPWQLAKLRCMLGYFDRISTSELPGRIVVARRALSPRAASEWRGDPRPLTALTVDERGAIEDTEQHLQVDFANRHLGGGVLRRGSVQEEIRFSVAPECLVAMILSPRMRDDEAIAIRGTERFALTRGYGPSLEYGGSYSDPAPRDRDGTPDVDLVAIDALDLQGDRELQFTGTAMLRELNKARAGWLRDRRGLPVATGNWGCGAFGGDVPLKAVLQWMAASAEGRALRYHTFGDARVGGLASFARQATARIRTVGELWRRLVACADPARSESLYDRLLQ
jgi:poly(ADP-ribose) glycohydrolase